MSPTPRFLTVEQVLAIHARLIEEFGGDEGLRDRGLLESAVAMPTTQFGGQFLHADLASQAAAYLFHLCKNHAFVDGNKRVSIGAAEIFIVANGATLRATNAQVEKITRSVAQGIVSKEEVVQFFKLHVKKRPRSRPRS